MLHPTYEQTSISPADPAAVHQIFQEGYENGLAACSQGTVASYIPELAKADGSSFGICA